MSCWMKWNSRWNISGFYNRGCRGYIPTFGGWYQSYQQNPLYNNSKSTSKFQHNRKLSPVLAVTASGASLSQLLEGNGKCLVCGPFVARWLAETINIATVQGPIANCKHRIFERCQLPFNFNWHIEYTY